ncbi:MAG: nuclear transport factor 2 family protein [Bacteroidota bacterium]
MKLINKIALQVLTFALLLCSGQLIAQDNADDRKVLENMLYEFAEAYGSLPQTKNVESVLQFFSKDATSNIFVFNISGKSRVQNYKTTVGFEAYMNKIIASEGITFKYDVTDVVDITVGNGIASVVYKVDYEIKEADGLWVKGKETVTLALEKKKGDWVIEHYTFIQMEDEKLKGTCLVEMYVGDTNAESIVTRTVVPNGRSYDSKFDNFEFRSIEGDWVIKVQDNLYKRLKTGPLYQISEDGEEEIGAPTSKKATIMMIIEDSLYEDSCARLKVK